MVPDTTTTVTSSPPHDEAALAAHVVTLLTAEGCNPSWRPRLRELAAIGTTRIRVMLGSGFDAYLYFTPEGKVRYSGCVPPQWRGALGRALGDLLDVQLGRGGFLARSS